MTEEPAPLVRGEKRRATDAEYRALASALRLRVLRLCASEALTNKEIAARFEGKTDLTDAQKATYKMASTGIGEPPCWCVDDIVKWCEQH